MSWSSVGDDAETADEPPSSPTGFKFDLGGALERLGETTRSEPAPPLAAEPISDDTVPDIPAGLPPTVAPAPPARPGPPPASPAAPGAAPAWPPLPPSAWPPESQAAPPAPAPTPPAAPGSWADLPMPVEPAPPPVASPSPAPPGQFDASPAPAVPHAAGPSDDRVPPIAPPTAEPPHVVPPAIAHHVPPATAASAVTPVPPIEVPPGAADPMMPAALPRRERPGSRAPQPEPPPSSAQPPAEYLPRRDAPAPVPADPAPTEPRVVPPARQPVARPVELDRRSVFDAAAPAPELPLSPTGQAAPPTKRPVIPPSVVQTLPALPTANPKVAPIENTDAGPIGPDIHAVRSYQLRAERSRQRSKLLGRTMLSFAILAGLVAAALFFGRPLLFPQDWDAALVPHVDRIQTEADAEFTGVVALQELPDEEYVPVALSASIGETWAARYPQWRALGIAEGDAASSAVAAAVIARRPAVYDPVSNTIYRAASAPADALDGAYDVALHEVFLRQQATPPNAGVTGRPTAALGVTSSREISSRALDRALSGATAAAPAVSAEVQAPLPLLYQLVAIDVAGASLLAEFPDIELAYGDPYPDAVLDALGVAAPTAAAPAVPEGAESLGDPIPLGLDAWSLVWDNRLPTESVDRLTSLVIADSYRAVRQSGKVCVVASFATASEAAAVEVVSELSRWTLVAPAESVATVTRPGPTTAQLFACDPGAGADQDIDPTTVDAVLGRQLQRLSP